ncbi:hypothetical protein F7725_005329 [Dissostichus mawsoni]|uniref:C2H2-type domain-containing protein n=1 Tax=Dissostichus mawsoni TaxID=36200 RepID=A0A7J5YQX4_DISMA|nr:hypothetical protein F7725_005329 [Dissostichus mawsoni]
METVFKAAMYEITRLVEDSFLEEVTRCREQVESLKRRLKWSEGRRKEREGERRGRCLDCGRVEVSGEETPKVLDKSLKQESVTQEEMSGPQESYGETQGREADEARPESHRALKATQSSGVQGEKLNRLFKEEALQITPEANVSEERWGGHLDGTGLPGPSKRFSVQKTQSATLAGKLATTRVQNQANTMPRRPSEPVLLNRYGMEDYGGFDKTGYGDSNMIDMGNLDGYKGRHRSWVRIRVTWGTTRGMWKHQKEPSITFTKRVPCETEGARTNIDVGGELSCLLINEEGIYKTKAFCSQNMLLVIKGQGLRAEPSSEDIYEPSYSDTLNLGEKLQHQAGGRGGRRHACNLCSMTFHDSALLKAHKQTHKGPSQAPPYSCTQCGKTFSQACNLKVHQRIHSGQGLHLCSHCGKAYTMSDLDTLIVTFQTQLSDVMETVVKTAMFEVTRLVEDGFLEEMQRRNQEVEALRMELQWAERKIRDQGGNTGNVSTVLRML